MSINPNRIRNHEAFSMTSDQKIKPDFIEQYGRLIIRAVIDFLKKSHRLDRYQELDDIYHEIIIIFYKDDCKNIKAALGANSPSGYIYTVSYNEAYKYCLKLRSDPLPPTHYGSGGFSITGIQCLDIGIDNRKIMEVIHSFLRGLSSKNQQLFELRFGQGKKFREIAEIMNIPENTVSSGIARIKKRILDCLNKLGFEKIED